MEKLLPQNIEAEASVLGSLLIDPEAISLVSDFLRAEDFYRDAHRTLYDAIIHLYERHEPADFVTVCHELSRENKLDMVGGESYIASLVSMVPTSGNIEHYGRIVERMATLRRLIHAGGQIVATAYGEDDADVVLEQAEQLIFAVRQGHALNRSQTAHIRAAVSAYMERLDMLQGRRGELLGVPTGFSDLDRLLGGLQRSDLIILAARPAVGKTSFALSLAHNAATQHQSRVGIFSLEMSVDQLVQRLISMESGVDQQRLRSGDLYDEDWSRVLSAMSVLSNTTLLIDETASLTTTQLRSKARQWVTEYGGLDLIIVDYLQLMQSAGNERRSDNRVQIIDEISRQLKVLARELNVPVLVLAQLSRAVETRQSKIPQLSDLRECVTGDTRLVDATTGRWVSISAVKEGMQILGVDNHQRIRPFMVERIWSTGVKPTYFLTTKTGRQIQATANHPFLTPQGWRCLEQLQVGDVIATAEMRDTELSDWATSDLLWEPIRSITPAGDAEVFDVTIPECSNFLANGIVAHNSGAIEQNADIVMFIYRDEVYNPETERKSLADIIIAKHRNGPTGEVCLHFNRSQTRFQDLVPEAAPPAIAADHYFFDDDDAE